ncbi:MAG: ABC transporter [Candidatus Schekmanbacteria bacterium RBG_13_48_7]|uniref:ABC transporter n=1 Tax=Candidatus Schekmanbacteria bacterium RBG_13_48_7 TaxID=1817878 RepID=A0A1F7RR15_9BACT|nr:MAG: ABC transporter [Candidatus Schekmanbacteria bacterium RBG_13_48_7]
MFSIRKIGVLGRTYRHLKRHQQVLGVLFKYGFGDLLDTLKVEQYFGVGRQWISKKDHVQIDKLTRAERIRLALQELGPTFIKLGQILSTRPDLIPLRYVQELSKLQDNVSQFSYDEVREIVKSETGRYPEDLFRHFETSPLAAASIGQVHRAQLMENDQVVVKVQRPGIRKIIEVDIEIMFHLASLMERHLEEAKLFRPTRILDEFANSLEKEIDYNLEASNIENFARQFMDDETVYIPRIYRELSTQRVLTMEYVEGIKASDVEGLQQTGYDLPEIARRGANSMMRQVFVHGYFHADPHPGNLFILPGNVICFLDFGMMGRIRREEREDFAELLVELIEKDEKKITEVMLNLTDYEHEPDKTHLEMDMSEFVNQYLFRPLKETNIAKMFQRLLEILAGHQLRLKPDLFLMIRAISAVETLGRSLDPDFMLMTYAEPLVRSVHLGRFAPKRIVQDLVDSGSELVTLLRIVPGEIRSILKLAKEGGVKVEFEQRGLDPLLLTHDRTMNRLVFAIVMAALIVGSSLIVLSGVPPKWHDIPVIGVVGFIVAGLMGFWMLISILRQGKM